MLKLADGAVVGHASGLACRLNTHVVDAAQLVDDLEHLGFPSRPVGLRHNPELAGANADFASHTSSSGYVSAEVTSFGMVGSEHRRYETRNPRF